jgi:two-component system, OmpR family, alkaline phosphatase synthesis response regulator PhoP
MKGKEFRVLIIEDEPAISMAVRDELDFEGFEVDVCEDGDAALRTIAARKPDLIILDLMLPGRSGFDLCREIRAEGHALPIIMLTARGDEVDRVRGLEIGADDYITKPFSLAELVARVRAVLRRCRAGGVGTDREELRAGDLRLDVTRHKVWKGSGEIELTHKEFLLLEMLLGNPGRVISRDEFLDRLWGEEVYVTHRTVDTHMANLRRKLEDDPQHPRHILGVRGVGYKLGEESEV